MLYVCDQRFDVTENLENFYKLNNCLPHHMPHGATYSTQHSRRPQRPQTGKGTDRGLQCPCQAGPGVHIWQKKKGSDKDETQSKRIGQGHWTSELGMVMVVCPEIYVVVLGLVPKYFVKYE